MDADRSRIFRDTQIINTGGFAGSARQRRKAGRSDDNAGNTRFFYIRGRPRRGRSTGPSGPVARKDGIAALFPGQQRKLRSPLALLGRIIADMRMRELRIGNDA